MKTGIILFPGSNCDHDAYYVIHRILNQPVRMIWHKDRTDLAEFDLILLPGGFSYGDYLRTGAIARFAPVMQDVMTYARRGGRVLGICNGFQILTECGLLPGALLRNRNLRFVCRNVFLRVENSDTAFTSAYKPHEVITVPIAHGDGNYFADTDTMRQLEEENRVVFRYCSSTGELSDSSNPNGSLENIAGVMNAEGNVLGMMPHPERCADATLRNEDGLRVFTSLVRASTQVLA